MPLGSPARRAEDLIADLARLDGAPCAACATPLCGHRLLASFAAGVKEAPRCLPCLGEALGRDPRDLARELARSFRHQACYRAAWEWAGRREDRCKTADAVGPIDAACGDEGDGGRQEAAAPGALQGILADATWDAGDLGCGELMIELRQRLLALSPGRLFKLIAQDSGAREDIPAWCRLTGNTLAGSDHPVYCIRKKG